MIRANSLYLIHGLQSVTILIGCKDTLVIRWVKEETQFKERSEHHMSVIEAQETTHNRKPESLAPACIWF